MLRMAPAMRAAVTQELDGEAEAERRQQDQAASNTPQMRKQAKGNRHAGNVASLRAGRLVSQNQ
jgi:hypothetical protein